MEEDSLFQLRKSEVVGGYNGSKESSFLLYRFVLPEPETYYALLNGPQLTTYA